MWSWYMRNVSRRPRYVPSFSLWFTVTDDGVQDNGKAIADFILTFADEDEHRDVQAKAVIGVVKLLFAGLVTEPRVCTCSLLLPLGFRDLTAMLL